MRTTASRVLGSTPSGTWLRIVSSPPPWNMPQSTRTRALPVSTRWREPVTVRAPPRKVSSMSGSSHIAVDADRDPWHDGGHVPHERLATPRGGVPRRARRPRPARHRAGDGRAIGPDGRRARGRRHRERRQARSWRRWTTSGRGRDEGGPDDDARALLAIRAAIADGFEGDVGLPVSPPVSRAACEDPDRMGGGDRGRRHGSPNEARGVLRRDRGDLAVDGETPVAAPDPRPTRLGARPGSATAPVPRARAAVARGRRRRRADVPVPRADPRVGRRLGGRRLPHRSQRGGHRARNRGRRAVGDRHPRGVAGGRHRAGSGPRRAPCRALGLVVAGRRGRAGAGRRRSRSSACSTSTAASTPRSARTWAPSTSASTPRRAPGARRSPSPSRPSAPVLGDDRTARWSPGAPTVLATYVDGGLGELTELVHETGHAIHIGAIRTRPAFTDWPDSDALTEALAELVSIDTAEPTWQQRWIGDAPALPGGRVDPLPLRGGGARRCMGPARDRLHADPERAPNDVWTEITGLPGDRAAPEWSWWAMRGQLVQEPGYMANYAIGAVLAADLRAAIRSARGDWTAAIRAGSHG